MTNLYDIPGDSLYTDPKGFTHIKQGFPVEHMLLAGGYWSPEIQVHRVCEGIMLEVSSSTNTAKILYPVMDQEFKAIWQAVMNGMDLKHSIKEAENKYFSQSTNIGWYLYCGENNTEAVIEKLGGITPETNLLTVKPVMQEFKGGKRIINANFALFAARYTDPDFWFHVNTSKGVFDPNFASTDPLRGITQYVHLKMGYKNREIEQIFPIVNGLDAIPLAEVKLMDVNRSILRGAVELLKRISGYGLKESDVLATPTPNPLVIVPKDPLASALPKEEVALKPSPKSSAKKAKVELLRPVVEIISVPEPQAPVQIEVPPAAVDVPLPATDILAGEKDRWLNVLSEAKRGKEGVERIKTLLPYFGKMEASSKYQHKEKMAEILCDELAPLLTKVPTQALVGVWPLASSCFEQLMLQKLPVLAQAKESFLAANHQQAA